MLMVFVTNAQQKSYYTGLYFEGIQTYSTGLYGIELKQRNQDLAEDFKSKGYTAKGDVTPRLGVGFGAFYGKYFSDQFVMETSLGLAQRGYTEHLSYEYGNDTASVSYFSNAEVKLNYLDWNIGVRYLNQYGWSIYCGAIYGINFYDRVDYDFEHSVTVLDSTEVLGSTHKNIYFHEYYGGANRNIYLPGYTLGLGYHYGRFELNAVIKQQLGLFYKDAREQNLFSVNANLKIYIVQ